MIINCVLVIRNVLEGYQTMTDDKRSGLEIAREGLETAWDGNVGAVDKAVQASEIKAGCANCENLKGGACALFEALVQNTGAPRDILLGRVAAKEQDNGGEVFEIGGKTTG